MKSIRITKPDKPIKGTVMLPSSKSISNRLLIMQAIAGTDFGIRNLSQADDTVLLQRLLGRISSTSKQQDAVVVDCSNAGTNLRFLTAFLSARPGRWVITGTERMKNRPVGELVESLRQIGASIEYLGNVGFPPLLIKGHALKSAELQLNAGVSSQFISALLMIAPSLPATLSINLKGEIVSEPYIDMTLRLMKECGISFRKWKHKITVEPGNYSCDQFNVESDWSAASFWYMAASLSDKAELEIPGLYEESLQGDSVLASAYTVFGVQSDFPHPASRIQNPASRLPHPASCILHPASRILHLTRQPCDLEGFYYDFTHHPDLALPVIAGCAALGLRGRFEGLKSLVVKESDRVRALTTELRKLGCKVLVSSDEFPVIEIQPSKLKANPDVIIDTYRDHRMAMTFAMLSLKTGSIRIADPGVVAKSYPGFWEELEKMGFGVGD